MKILKSIKEIPVVGKCPYCDSMLEIERKDIWEHINLDESISPYVACIACGEEFSVENFENIDKIFDYDDKTGNRK